MAEHLHRGTFAAADLQRVPDPRQPVLLKSGGPIMEVLEDHGDEVVCEWADGRATFPKASLYRLVPFNASN